MKDVFAVCLHLTGPAMRVPSKTVEHHGDALALQSGKLVVICFCFNKQKKPLKNHISGPFTRLIHTINPVG